MSGIFAALSWNCQAKKGPKSPVAMPWANSGHSWSSLQLPAVTAIFKPNDVTKSSWSTFVSTVTPQPSCTSRAPRATNGWMSPRDPYEMIAIFLPRRVAKAPAPPLREVPLAAT